MLFQMITGWGLECHCYSTGSQSPFLFCSYVLCERSLDHVELDDVLDVDMNFPWEGNTKFQGI